MVRDKDFFMRQALQQAAAAQEIGEVPVGAVVVHDDRVVGRGHNAVIKSADPTAHAEIVALRRAGKRAKNYRLPDMEVYVTLEPCLMCYTALVQARVKKLYFAADDGKTGVFSTGAFDGIQHIFNHRVEVEPGILREESSRLLNDFFRVRRGAGAVERGGLENR